MPQHGPLANSAWVLPYGQPNIIVTSAAGVFLPLLAERYPKEYNSYSGRLGTKT